MMVEAEKVLVVLHIRNWTFSPTPSVDSIREFFIEEGPLSWVSVNDEEGKDE